MPKRIAMLLLLACSASCALGPPAFEVTVDALASSGGSDLRTYSLASGNEGVSVEDLQFQEFAQYLNRALQAQGFSATSRPQEAQLNIVLSYGIEGPLVKEENYSRAIWGQTGFSAIYYPYESDGAWCRNGGRYYYLPRYGVAGYSTGTRSVTTYAQHISIEAFPTQDFEQSDKPQVLWRVDLESVGKRNDLRQGFPIMLAAATPYLGSNSGQKLELELNEDDEAVQFLKGAAVR